MFYGFEECSFESVITRCRIFVQPNLLVKRSSEKKLFHHRVSSNNAKGTFPDKVESQFAIIILTGLKFNRNVFC